MTRFITENFLLQTPSGVRLYHEYAKDMPIIDYHCHLPTAQVAQNHRFENMTQIWLGGDHYKWRALRAAGVDEKYITGNGSDWEKFEHWATIFPTTLRNPLFHWTMLELNRPFGINDVPFNRSTARAIWEQCNGMLSQDTFSARGLMKQMNVRLVCTTDDPVDSLEYHQALAKENASGAFGIRVLPTFRPDKVLPLGCTTPAGISAYKNYLSILGETADIEINSFAALRSVLLARHDYFHACGCRLSDHGFELFNWREEISESQTEFLFARVLNNDPITSEEAAALGSILLDDVARADARRGWTMQLHIGAMRNNSSRIFAKLGPDAGCDSMVDGAFAKPLSRFLDRLDREELLPKTIVYNLNPDCNYMLASLVANFNDGSMPGKMQYGSGWWFLDQKNGMEQQIDTLSNMGLLSRFVGMLTDSRSFLSYTRHEYFRRILCNILGTEMDNGLLPKDFDWVGKMVQDISFNNAKDYFGFDGV
ncbi:MAG: glucuronate isomerase [Planctomycetia bacterium]|nr:glucuronate isomerase [Planctomycetia bacterium]